MQRMMIVLLVLVLAACGAPATAAPSPDTVLEAFRAAGLTVDNVTTTDALIPELQSAAPSCTAYRFEVGVEDNGGRVVSCTATSDAEKVAKYYTALGESNALFFSHVHSKGPLVLQMNGAIDKSLFEQYVAALP